MATLRLILTTTTTWMWSASAQEQSVSTASSSRSRDASSTTLTLKSSQGTFSSTGCWLDSIKDYQSLVYDVLHIFSSSSLSCYLPIFFVKVVIFCYWTTKKKILNFRRCMVVFFYKQLVKAAENEESIFRRADDGFFEQVVLQFSPALILIHKSILKYRRYLKNGRPSKITYACSMKGCPLYLFD